MTLAPNRLVNGARVFLTDAEIAERQAEEQAWRNSRAAAIKLEAAVSIDAKAGQVRARYITVAAGQEATYLLKAAAADAFAAASFAGAVPALVQAEADATGQTPTLAAQSIRGERDLWVGKAAQIEQARRAGKIAVAAISVPAQPANDAELEAAAAAVGTARDAAIAALDLL